MDDEIIIETGTPSSFSPKQREKNRRTLHEIEEMIRKGDSRIQLKRKSKHDEKSLNVWQSFYHIHMDGVRQDFVRCDGCGKIFRFISRYGTNGLKKHIRSCSKLVNEKDGVQLPITSHFTTQGGNQKDFSRIPNRFFTQMVKASAEYCALDGRAFESITGVGLQRVIQVAFDAGRVCAAMKRPINVKELLPSSITV